MLEDFVIANKAAIIERARAVVASRTTPVPSAVELSNGIPVFLEQLIDALRRSRFKAEVDNSKLGVSAGRHGADLLRMGLTIGQVVHDYGAVCQTISTLALEQGSPIATDEFRTLNLCLDDAIAGAVTEYSRSRERTISEASTERLGTLAHELRNLLSIAMLSYESIRAGRVAVGGSTGVLMGRTLLGLRDLIDRSLNEVRLEGGITKLARFSVAEMVEEVEIGALLQTQARGLRLVVTPVARTVIIEGDWPSIAAALSNLLHNAFKFTKPNSTVTLKVHTTPTRVLFDVQDECGGLPEGSIEGMFRPYEQRSGDRSGVGLGLYICRKAARANDGDVTVKDLPGVGCVFTLEFPRVDVLTAA